MIRGSARLNNCGVCIATKGEAEVSILAGGEITCEARENGINARDNSTASLFGISFEVGVPFLNISSSSQIVISGQVNGIKAEDSSLVDLGAGFCRIEGDQDAIIIEGNAEVDTTKCLKQSL